MENANLTLSITTIGDLLLEKAITNGGNRIKDVELSIPDYQRPYKWTARNAIQLLDDIIEAKGNYKEKYRVGTLILHHEGDKFYIVDGQQRIITFTLLLKALSDTSERPESYFLHKKGIFDNTINAANILNNYNALLRRIGPAAEPESDTGRDITSERKKLRGYIEEQCELIVVITNDISEAFQFFDSQNARGKALYPHDLLKAYHLREMDNISEEETEKIVNSWEKIEQQELADFFGKYLYRIKEWVKGNKADVLNEQNIQMFKGITRMARTPFAQFYKSAYSYAEMVNTSAMPFVSGVRKVNAFQLDTPIIAGKPFFDYTKHYYAILEDIKDNNKYEGFYINDNQIVKTLDKYYKWGIGNGIARLMFDTALLLYVDRFCPETYPTREDLEWFDQFTVYAFIWAYSLRAQYANLGWKSAQNYITEQGNIVNTRNIYRMITGHDTPTSLLSALADTLKPITEKGIIHGQARKDIGEMDKKDEERIYKNYLHFFKTNQFYK